jgi:tRNA pseudouridine55 synthase
MGLLLIDKEAGLTSHDVVAKVRRAAGHRSVGHTGTLDPMATGLMVLLLGAATKLEPWLVKCQKTYQGVIRLGLSTDTDDVTGRELNRYQGPWPTIEEVQMALAGFVGQTLQVPPAYSAIKVGGLVAHRAARSGQPISLAPRKVTAHWLTCQKYEPPYLYFSAGVSSGYYIRSLARDLGASLGLGGGVLASLRRLSVGIFSISDAGGIPADLQEIDSRILNPRKALELPEVHLSPIGAGRLRAGAFVSILDNSHLEGLSNIDSLESYGQGPLKAIGPDGSLIALAQIISPPKGADHREPQGPYLRPLRVLMPVN